MKFARTNLHLAGAFAIGAISLAGLARASAQQTYEGEKFPGVQKALSPEQYSATGLSKLSPEERVRLDEYLKGYFSGASQRVAERASQIAASQAVDQAVKARKVEPPQLIESRIIGKINGWKSGKVVELENGQRWKITDEDRYARAVENPDVFIVRDFLSYKMAIAGIGTARVVRTQ